jgi:uncharacterized protein (DUF697 family)
MKPTFDELIESATNEAQKFIESTTDKTGRSLKSIAENPLLKPIKNVFGMDVFMAILGEVDQTKVKATVSKLQLTYPTETPSQIANRILVQKAWEAGRVGFLTNIIPPIAAVLLSIELAAITKMQAEMVYEIAAAYGLDLDEPARRGEVLAIFGLSMGGGVLKTGLGFVEILPVVGPVLGASSDATILYALGYTACQFYQRKYEENLKSQVKAKVES